MRLRAIWLVALLLCLPGLAVGQDFIKYYPAGISAGGTITGPLLLPDGTAAAPSLAFASAPGTGIRRRAGGGNPLCITTTGNSSGLICFNANDISMYNGTAFGWGSGDAGTSQDLILWRDAANTLALRNFGTAGTPVPQAFNVYNFCDGAACATGYTRGTVKFASNLFIIGTEFAGTGATAGIAFAPGGTNRWFIHGSTYALYPGGDGTQLFGGPTFKIKEAYFAESIQGSKSKTLTDAAAAASIWSCAVPTSDSIGGELIWTTESTDATDYRVTQGSIRFAGVNKAGTTTCTIGVIGTDLTASSNGNTLVCTWTNVASGTNCLLSATCTDNTGGSQTMAVNSRLDMPIPQVCTPQ